MKYLTPLVACSGTFNLWRYEDITVEARLRNKNPSLTMTVFFTISFERSS